MKTYPMEILNGHLSNFILTHYAARELDTGYFFTPSNIKLDQPAEPNTSPGSVYKTKDSRIVVEKTLKGNTLISCELKFVESNSNYSIREVC